MVAPRSPLFPEACRDARRLLGLTPRGLADAAGVDARALGEFEAGLRGLERAVLDLLARTLAGAGVDLHPTPPLLRERPPAGKVVLPRGPGGATS